MCAIIELKAEKKQVAFDKNESSDFIHTNCDNTIVICDQTVRLDAYVKNIKTYRYVKNSLNMLRIEDLITEYHQMRS